MLTRYLLFPNNIKCGAFCYLIILNITGKITSRLLYDNTGCHTFPEVYRPSLSAHISCATSRQMLQLAPTAQFGINITECGRTYVSFSAAANGMLTGRFIYNKIMVRRRTSVANGNALFPVVGRRGLDPSRRTRRMHSASVGGSQTTVCELPSLGAAPNGRRSHLCRRQPTAFVLRLFLFSRVRQPFIALHGSGQQHMCVCVCVCVVCVCVRTCVCVCVGVCMCEQVCISVWWCLHVFSVRVCVCLHVRVSVLVCMNEWRMNEWMNEWIYNLYPARETRGSSPGV